MFGRDSVENKLQKAMKQMGADAAVVKNWFRTLEKMKKSAPMVRSNYENAIKSTQELLAILEQMERVITESGSILSDRQLEQLRMGQKSMEKLSGCCDHSFVVSPEDREFHLTFDTLVNLEIRSTADSEQKLIFQSEIENLLALTKENLNREPPSLTRLCYYYVNRSGRELEKLPPEERLEKISRVYQNEFIERMRSLLADCIAEANRLREASGHTDKNIEVLLSYEVAEKENDLHMAKTKEDFERQADAFLVALCSL